MSEGVRAVFQEALHCGVHTKHVLSQTLRQSQELEVLGTQISLWRDVKVEKLVDKVAKERDHAGVTGYTILWF